MILSHRSGNAPIQIEFFVRQICERIKTMREEMKISQDAMGKYLGISGQAFGKLEKGTSKLTVLQLFQIAETLKCPLDRLLDIEPSDSIVENLESQIKQLQTQIRNLKDQDKQSKLFIDLLQDKLKSNE